MKERIKKIFDLFITFYLIGLITFGGGYVMLGVIKDEIVSQKKWITDSDMTELIAISESTPGPFAINAATFIGYKLGGFWGAFFAVLGVVLPSFFIVLLIIFLKEIFAKSLFIKSVLRGMQVGVIALIFRAGFLVKKSSLKIKLANFIIFIGFIIAAFTSLNLIFVMVIYLYFYFIIRKYKLLKC